MLREGVTSAILDDLHVRLDDAEVHLKQRGRPFITLAYAQSLDGSIAGNGGRPLCLSGERSLQLTHGLRAAHDAILVGIGTVLSDDPRLNVRLVAGTDPRPIVVDSHLRCPAEAKLMDEGRGTWIAATERASDQEVDRFTARGATVLRMPSLDNGWVDLEALVARVAERGLAHLLVEGGTRILTSFMKARLADYAVITVAPRFVGGVNALVPTELEGMPALRNWRSERFGDDLVLAGELGWEGE